MKIFDKVIDLAANAIDEERNNEVANNGAEGEATEQATGKKPIWKWVTIGTGTLILVGAGIWGGKKLLGKKKAEGTANAEGEEKKETKDEKKK